MKMGDVRCRKCGGNAMEIGGYLVKVKGTDEWECRPDCSTRMKDEDRLLAAIEGKYDGR